MLVFHHDLEQEPTEHTRSTQGGTDKDGTPGPWKKPSKQLAPTKLEVQVKPFLDLDLGNPSQEGPHISWRMLNLKGTPSALGS